MQLASQIYESFQPRLRIAVFCLKIIFIKNKLFGYAFILIFCC